MKPIQISDEDLLSPTRWATKGQSPTHSPQAIVQAVQVLLPIAMDPTVGMASGLQLHELVRTFVENSALQNADGIQADRDATNARLTAPGGPLGPMVGAGGGQDPSGLPAGPFGPGGAAPA